MNYLLKQKTQKINLDTYKSEIIAFYPIDDEHGRDYQIFQKLLPIEAFSDYSFSGSKLGYSQVTINVKNDKSFHTQVSWEKEAFTLLESNLPIGPDVEIKKGYVFKSHITWTTFYDVDKPETARYLTRNKVLRLLSPWSTENPLVLHLVSNNEEIIKKAIEDTKAVGFEMIILSFGSGVNIEDMSPRNIDFLKDSWKICRNKMI